MPFEKDQTREVISKVDFDRETKKEFVANIFEKRYEKYKGFFATPLLTLMMLMTYLQIRHIPDNVHIFYRYAFQTLFTLHDASKEGFQRKRRLNLSEQQFMEIFSFFCLATYADMRHSFNEQACLDYVQRAITRANAECVPNDFLVDSTDAVNMMFKDGDQYTFIHRSFQEYFAAYAISHFFLGSLQKLLPRIPNRESDSVLSMARAINPQAIGDFYLLPEYKVHEAYVARLLKTSDALEILSLLDMKVELGFYVEEHTYSPNMYHAISELSSYTFVNIAYSMFKDRAPKEMLAVDENHPINESFRNLGDWLRRRHRLRVEATFIDVEIDASSKEMRVSWPVGDDLRSEVVSLADFDWHRELPLLESLASRSKARAVHVKRMMDEIKRNNRKAREMSDEILSM